MNKLATLAILLLTVQLSSGYVFGPTYVSNSMAYPEEQHYYQYYDINRLFVHQVHHPLIRVHHQVPRVRDYHMAVHTYSVQDVNVVHPPVYSQYSYGYSGYTGMYW